MLEKAWLFTIFFFIPAASMDQEFVPTSNLERMKTCPFPMPENIQPCSCKANEKFHIFLICYIDQDMDRKLLQRLTQAFACKKEIHLFDINLNGHRWMTDFSPELLGQFKISHFHLSNFSYILGDIRAGAFNGSSFSLKEFHIETSEDENKERAVETGAFSKLQALSKVSLGNSFSMIKSKAFFDLPNFKQLEVDEQSISTIETEAFADLPMMKILNLSNQSIIALPSRAFCNLSNLTELNLSNNMIKKIQDNIFYNLPSLTNLDLSRNSELCQIGNMFEHLQNADLAVNLAETDVTILLQAAFKPFIETVTENNGKGYIDLSDVPMQCTCDVKWLVTSNFEWTNIVKNSSCNDGHTLEEVDRPLLENLCPPDNCPGYDAGSGQMNQYCPLPGCILDSLGFPGSQFVVVDEDKVIDVWVDGSLGFFLVGGGGGGDKGKSAGSSGFFKYEMVKATTKSKQTVKISIGQGGSINGGDGTPTSVDVDGYIIMANGGGGNAGPGWSGGGDDSVNGYYNGGGSNGSGEQLPQLCGNVNLSYGAGGLSSNNEGGGGGGLIADDKKPERNSFMDGEGYGAGGAEMNHLGYPGVVVVMICD